jgi:tetratricopeptide (TPR) repeat protein
MRRSLLLFLLSSLLFACSSQDIKIDDKQSQSHYKLALEFAQLNLVKNALEEFDLAIKFNPENPKIYRKKGILLFGMKRYKEAKNSFQKTIQLDPKDVQAHINIGMVHYNSGDKDEALKAWEHAVGINYDDNDSKALNNIGNIYKIKNNLQKAIEFYQKAITFEPTNSTYLNNLGDSYRLTGDLKKAKETLLESLEVDTNGMLTHFNLGTLYQTEKNFKKAIDSFQKSLNINPSYTEAYYQLANTHLKANNKESARLSMEKAIQADPGNLKFRELYNKISAL